MDSSVSRKDEIWFLRVCHHISNAVFCVPSNVRVIATAGQGYEVSDAKSPGKLNPLQWHLIFMGVPYEYFSSRAV